MKIKTIASSMLIIASLMLSGCSSNSEKEFAPTDQYVKDIGRTYLAEDNTRWIVMSAAGVEFTFTGKSASVVITGDETASAPEDQGSYARYAVYVDGERVSEGLVDQPEKTVEIFSSSEEKETTVKILKLSESANSIFGIKSINVNSKGDIAPTPDKDLKIEFIGDSITCGYGVDDEDMNHHFATNTEDATKAYAVKTAELLDADYSLVSFSGHGIISGYSGNGRKQASQLVPNFYTKVGRTYGKAPVDVSKIDWDFSSFVPDVVVINLGTNDDSYVKGDEEKTFDYIDGYVKFLGTIREKNPDAQIVCTLGTMGDNLYPAIEEAVSRYTAASGDSKVSCMHFDLQDMNADGIAADWHPSAKTHSKAAEKLAEEIKSLIK